MLSQRDSRADRVPDPWIIQTTLPKYHVKEMKHAPGGSVWASRRRSVEGGQRGLCSLPHPLALKCACHRPSRPQPTLTQTLQGISHLAGVEQGCGKGVLV